MFLERRMKEEGSRISKGATLSVRIKEEEKQSKGGVGRGWEEEGILPPNWHDTELLKRTKPEVSSI